MYQLQVPQWRVKAFLYLHFSFSVFLFSSSIIPPRLWAFYTDIKINTVCVWLVHRMHRHYRMHRLRMCDPPPPTFAPTIIPYHTYSLSVTLLFSTPLSLRVHARTAAAAVTPCSRHGWRDESKCEPLRERWRAWGIWRWVKNGFIKWRSAWDNKWSNRCTLECFCFVYSSF